MHEYEIKDWGFTGVTGFQTRRLAVLFLRKEYLASWVIGFEVLPFGFVVFLGPFCAVICRTKKIVPVKEPKHG